MCALTTCSAVPFCLHDCAGAHAGLVANFVRFEHRRRVEASVIVVDWCLCIILGVIGVCV